MTASDPSRVTLSDVARGDRTAILQTCRAQLLAALADAGPRELPAISRELRQVLAELDGLGGKAEESKVDQLAARRAAHVAAAARASGT